MKLPTAFLAAALCIAAPAALFPQTVSQVVNSIVATTCTNQFIRSIAATGVGTCASVAIGSDVSGLGSGVATFLTTPSSGNLLAALTDETGTGSAVFGTSPTFTASIFVNSVDATGVRVGDGTNDYVFARNSASGNLFISGLQGSGASGFRFRTNATTEVFNIGNSGSIAMPLIASTSAAQTGTLCWATSTGNVTVDTTTTCLLSSARFKHDIRPLSDSLKTVLALKPVSYEYNDPMIKGEQVGFVAEDVAELDNRLVSRGADGSPRAVRYQQLTAILAGAIQSLKKDNDMMRQRIEKLEGR